MRLSALVSLCGLFAIVPTACLYDADDRCGPHQVSISNDRCACDDGFVPGSDGCVPCGENEEASNGECVCADGYARASAAEACAPIPADLGAECDTDENPCVDDGPYPLCHETEGSAGYCTSACASSDDCDGGYQCQVDGEDSYCRRPPLGFGDSCDSDADCAGGEATFCETIQSHLCLVPCSAGNTAGCFVGDVCCNFVIFAPVCIPADACEPSGGTEVQ